MDESGDRSLDSIDATYPIFVLALCIFKKTDYARIVAPAVIEFKFKHFGHDQVILHEREIRQSIGAFSILLDKSVRDSFLPDLNTLIDSSPFALVACVIRKVDFAAKQRTRENPYHVAVAFALEQIYQYLKVHCGCDGGSTHILFEQRGKK